MEVVYALLQKIAAIVVGALLALGAFFTGSTPASLPVSSPAATTTGAGFPVASSTKAAATSTPTKAPAQAQSKVVEQKSGLPGSSGLAGTGDPRTFVQQLSTEQLNTLARASLVNILCTTGAGGSFNPISGSGVIIDSRGIILTNAHVAQYFLLRDYPIAGNVQCVVRMGSPAQPRYTAKLLYLPPSWVAANATKIKDQTPTGTGENDYAFVLITGTTNPDAALPSSFPALPMSGADPEPGDPVLLAAYPAGFLGGIAISTSLYPTSALATVGQLYTFGDQNDTDAFSLGGTVVAQSGSSGGAAVNGAGKLQGIISTEITADTTAGRDLRAITIAHIDRSLFALGQNGITGLLLKNAAAFAADFNAHVAPGETKQLVDALK